MEIFDVIKIKAAGSGPSLGALTGSRVSHEVFQSINDDTRRSFFGEDFDNMNKEFFNTFVRPMDQMGLDLSRTVNALFNPDRMRVLNSIEDFKTIPLSMELPILMYAPVLKLFKEGRVEGFNFNFDSLPEEDIWGRLIDNFSCEDVASASDDKGFYPITGTLDSEDPDLSDEEIWSIYQTRNFIREKLLRETDRDPTAIDIPRG